MPIGGARFGAGRHVPRQKAEDSIALDVNYLSRNGYLDDGNWKRLYWKRHGKIILEVLIKARQNHFTIDLGATTHTIKLTHTSSNFGGSRRWFLCPSCNKRMGVLYLRFKYLGCRYCQRISYESQSINAENRIAWKYHKQFDKLFLSRLYKGAKHNRAFEKFLVIAEQYEDIIEQARLSISSTDKALIVHKNKIK